MWWTATLKLAHGAAVDGRHRQLQADQVLLRRHFSKHISLPVLALGFRPVFARFAYAFEALNLHRVGQ